LVLAIVVYVGQLLQNRHDVWAVDPNLWHAHPLTEPIATLVAVVCGLLAAAVASVISWWSKLAR